MHVLLHSCDLSKLWNSGRYEFVHSRLSSAKYVISVDYSPQVMKSSGQYLQNLGHPAREFGLSLDKMLIMSLRYVDFSVSVHLGKDPV